MNTIPWNERFFEEFEVGEVCRHRQSRTVTGYDNLLFTLLSQNPAPLHLNQQYASAIGQERMPFNSTLTLALVTGQSVADLTPNVMTNLGWTDIQLPNPVFEGDTIYSESRVESLRASASRKNVGIMSVRTTGYKQDGTIVIEFVRTVMIYRRGHAPEFKRPEPQRAAGKMASI